MSSRRDSTKPWRIFSERVDDSNFEGFFKGPASVVSYGIANCVPCAEFEPTLERAAAAYAGRVRFGKALMHIPGSCREIKKRFLFETFPTTHFYRQGALVLAVDRKMEYDELAAAINVHLLS